MHPFQLLNLQVKEYIGAIALDRSLKLSVPIKRKRNFIADTVRRASTSADIFTTTNRKFWLAEHLEEICAQMCMEMQNTIKPWPLRMFVRNADQAELAMYFCCASWLRPHIADDSETGVYSTSAKAHVYREAVGEMKKLAVIALTQQSTM